MEGLRSSAGQHVDGPARLHREGEERNPLRLAACPVLLHLLAVAERCRVTSVCGNLAQLERVNHGDVDGCVFAMGPVWQQDVRWSLVRAVLFVLVYKFKYALEKKRKISSPICQLQQQKAIKANGSFP